MKLILLRASTASAWCFFTCVALAQAPAWPLDTPAQSVTQERDRIGKERNAEDARYASEQAVCYQRFAVNDCLRDLRVRHRQVMESLRQQEIQLNDLGRRQRAAEQLRSTAEKTTPAAQEEARQRRESAQAEHQNRLQRSADRQAERESAQPDPAPRKDGTATSTNGPGAAQQAENRRLFEEKQQKAQERKAQREKTLNDKAAKPAVQDLPAKAP